MFIRDVRIEDAARLLEIYTPYVLETAISFEKVPPTKEEFIGRIETISSKYPYLVAEEDGEILGYAYAGAFKTRAAYDWSVETTVYVKQGLRGRGVGRALYEELERLLRNMGIKNMNACIGYPPEGVTENKYITMGSPLFHEKMGYTLVGRFHGSGFKFGQWFDMIWMEKMIGDHTEDCQPVDWTRRKTDR